MNEIDIARLAAYIDGEGCILITRKCSTGKNNHGRKYHFLRVVVGNTDPRLMSWLKNTFGGYINTQMRNLSKNSRRVSFTWIVHSKAAEDLLRFCMPYFVMKQGQAALALEYRDTYGEKVGRKGLGPDIFEIREGYRIKLSEMKKEVGTLLSVKGDD